MRSIPTSPRPRRFRINGGFGRPPRFVLARTFLQSRLIAWRLRQPA